MASLTSKSTPLSSRRIPKLTSLADQVYERLRLAIIRGELEPGRKLVELEIADEMGTSQGPVREALQRLERDGLVERQARSATFVTTISVNEMYELFSVRSVIEGFAIRRTAEKVTPEQGCELQELIEKMVEAAQRNDMASEAEYDMEFHRRICEWSESTGLMHAWRPLSNQLERFIVQTHPEHFPDLVTVATRHQPIIDALLQHDPDLSSRVIQEHIMLIWSRIRP